MNTSTKRILFGILFITAMFSLMYLDIARTDSKEWDLRRFLPELAYLDGVIGYLRLSTTERVPLTNNPTRSYKWIQRAFAEYESKVGDDAAANATGLSKAMLGMLLSLRSSA